MPSRSKPPSRRAPATLAVLARQAISPRVNPEQFLANTGLGRTVIELRSKQTVFSQGDPADAVFYIQKGRVRLTVVSNSGKEATVALLGPGDFVGESSITGAGSIRITT